MKILIVGSGGREYSIGLKLKEEKNEIYFWPGNGATDRIGTNLKANGFEELKKQVRELNIDFTVVGPEAPLTDGIVDSFKNDGLKIFGPSKSAARLEGSKAYMKDFAYRHNLPTAKYFEVKNLDEAKAAIAQMPARIVVKADGLCAGKGVIICADKDEALDAASGMLSGESFGEAGKVLVIEEFLDGFELSVFGISDGQNFITLPPCQDHKRLLDNNEGPNTGGMGAYSPTPLATSEMMEKINARIIRPAIDGMKKDGNSFEGVLFCGIMVVNNEPYLLEFNVRFGDPECEVLMPLFDSSLTEMFLKCIKGDIASYQARFKDQFSLGVVAASKEYPYKNSESAEIIVDASLQESGDSHISYAGVAKKDGKLLATGGRVLVYVASGASVKEAREKAYEGLQKVKFDGMQYRSDIAHEALR